MLISFVSTCSKSNITAKLLCVNKDKGVADQGSLRLYNINTIQKYELVNYFKGIVKLRYSEIDTHCMILDIFWGYTVFEKLKQTINNGDDLAIYKKKDCLGTNS